MGKILISVLTIGLLLTLSGCSKKLSYYDSFSKDNFNQNLFYRNDLKTRGADPSVITITEGEEKGYFYMYNTTEIIGATGVYSWRTKNFNDWEVMGPAFIPERGAWTIREIWAPEVIFRDGKYYMYYTGKNEITGRRGMSVAVSDSPSGPFKEFVGTGIDGKEYNHKTQIFDFGFPAIDASPFLDGDDFYLYFSKDQVDGVSSIYGVKMLDMVTPDMDTLKLLTYPTFATNEEMETSGLGSVRWEHKTTGANIWNEGAFMYKHNDLYYLTYSANPFWSREYAVGYAVSDSPLGDFEKPKNNRVLGVDVTWDHMSGTGHHSFFKAGEELFIAYHAHVDRVYGDSGRAIAVDRVVFVGDKLHINGPTYSIQPLSEVSSGYRNVIKEAKLSTDILNDRFDLLTDGVVQMHIDGENDFEYEVEDGKITITIKFDEAIKTRAILVYNSVDIETSFMNIKKITLNKKLSANNIGFNPLYLNNYDPENIEIRPGGAFIIEYDEIDTNEIKIEIENDKAFKISEIVVLGR